MMVHGLESHYHIARQWVIETVQGQQNPPPQAPVIAERRYPVEAMLAGFLDPSRSPGKSARKASE